jgi:hypothetical protein
MSIESKRVKRDEKRRKTRFVTLEKAYFSSCSSIITPYNYSFASAVQRRIEELKLALP